MTDCCRHCEHEAGYQHAHPCPVCDEGMAEPLSALSVAELILRDIEAALDD